MKRQASTPELDHLDYLRLIWIATQCQGAEVHQVFLDHWPMLSCAEHHPAQQRQAAGGERQRDQDPGRFRDGKTTGVTQPSRSAARPPSSA